MKASETSSGVAANSGSLEPIMRFVQSKILERSSSGMPIISAMAWSGSSLESSVTKSQPPVSHTLSTMTRVRFSR
ncbi:unannotated protein [freshwater metagenome]|uniref:Unannotated protein n=1 Tax=freshwater metagenome TaxID=449393 RepID=A0A6J7AKY0_9ZZZZ